MQVTSGRAKNSCADARVVLRERYLRDDVACGVERCSICAPLHASIVSPVLPANGGELGHNLFSEGHFVLPDTNVFLAQVLVMSLS